MQTSSALDQILMVEAELAQLLSSAKETAATRVCEAQHQVQALKNAAQITGCRDGQVEHERILGAARIEAESIINLAREEAESIDSLSPETLSMLATPVRDIVLAVLREGMPDEP